MHRPRASGACGLSAAAALAARGPPVFAVYSRARRRMLAMLMVVALLFATTEFLSHIDTPARGPTHATHCELCLAWSGGAASPATPAWVVRSALLTRLPNVMKSVPAPARRLARAHRSRAPPSFT